MREYNLFVIQKEYVSIYQKRPKELFQLLYHLETLNYNYNYGITLFEQLCKKIEIEAICHYFYQKYGCKQSRKYRFNEGIIELKPTRIIIRSTVDLPRCFSIFNRYNHNIFVCDFQNQDYFFLNDFLKKKLLQSV